MAQTESHDEDLSGHFDSLIQAIRDKITHYEDIIADLEDIEVELDACDEELGTPSFNETVFQGLRNTLGSPQATFKLAYQYRKADGDTYDINEYRKKTVNKGPIITLMKADDQSWF